MINETLGKAHADGAAQAWFAAFMIFIGMKSGGVPGVVCGVIGVAVVVSIFIINWRFRKIDKGEWPSAYYDGKPFSPLVEDGDENG